MRIVDLFAPDCIELNLKATGKWEAIHELALLFYAAGRIDSLESYEDAVRQREMEISTGVGFGVGIPHGKSPSVLQPSIALGVSKGGVQFDAIDQQPVQLVFLLAIPSSTQNKEYLQTLAELARWIVHEGFRQQLLMAETRGEVLATIQNYQQFVSVQ